MLRVATSSFSTLGAPGQWPGTGTAAPGSRTAVASAMVVLTHRNEVICALALAFNLVSISGLYFLLDAQFIGFLQLIVYAGAIMVLILFVVMLLRLLMYHTVLHLMHPCVCGSNVNLVKTIVST